MKNKIIIDESYDGITKIDDNWFKFDGSIEVDIPKGQSLNRLFDGLTESAIEVTSLRNKSNRLEEFFLRLVQSSQNGKAS